MTEYMMNTERFHILFVYEGVLRMLYKVGVNIPGEHDLCAVHIEAAKDCKIGTYHSCKLGASRN